MLEAAQDSEVSTGPYPPLPGGGKLNHVDVCYYTLTATTTVQA